MIKSTLPYKVKKIDFEQNTVNIIWQNGNVSKLPFHFLRLHCPCASCINELTGEKILDAKKIFQNITPVAESKNRKFNALQIKWSDNHDTGIYFHLCK